MNQHLINFHLAALRGVLSELLEDVPHADDATFKRQLALLKEIRKNIRAEQVAK